MSSKKYGNLLVFYIFTFSKNHAKT